MNNVSISPRVWPTVAAETLAFWMRRHKLMILALATATMVAGLTTITGTSSSSSRALSLAAGYAPIIAGMLAMGGIVSDERSSGLILMWLQKPGTLFRAYFVRYALYQALIGVLAFALAVIVSVAGLYADAIDVDRAMRLPVGALPAALIPAAIVFACSAWGIRRDAITGAIIVFLSVMTTPNPTDQSVLSQFRRIVSYPLDAIGALSGHPAYGPDVAGPLLIVAGHLVGWTVIGLLGLRFTEHILQRSG